MSSSIAGSKAEVGNSRNSGADTVSLTGWHKTHVLCDILGPKAEQHEHRGQQTCTHHSGTTVCLGQDTLQNRTLGDVSEKGRLGMQGRIGLDFCKYNSRRTAWSGL